MLSFRSGHNQCIEKALPEAARPCFMLYPEQISMGAGTVKIYFVSVYPVYQQPVRGNMTFPPPDIIPF